MVGAVQDVSEIPKTAVVKNVDLSAIYSENVLAKIIQVAQRGFKQQAPLKSYPHTVPQTGPNAGHYEEREALFWTCGFFPGSIYALLERSIKYPQALSLPSALRLGIQEYLLNLGRHYSVAISQMSSRTDTHDMGFIVQPALQRDWELTGNKESLAAVVNAAEALASRYDERVKAIRSWDVAVNDRYSLTDMNENFLVIIDSMCNLDLLYYTAHQTSSPHLAHIATTHANSIISEILREDYSSYHLVNFNPHTGVPQAKLTNQGFADSSTWSRGQAWSIMGFAQTYTWTKDTRFLETAVGCANYFLRRCEEGNGKWKCCGVPRWDFDAPVTQEEEEDTVVGPLRDVSAGVIAANGLLIIHQALQGLESSVAAQMTAGRDFLGTALEIVKQTIELAYDGELASFRVPGKAVVINGNGVVGGGAVGGEVGGRDVSGAAVNEADFIINASPFDGILRHSTTNWNEHAHQKYKDHGLVYADYYLLEFGNKLLRAGLV